MGIIIIIIPLAIYLIAAISVKKENIIHPDDYFAAFKKVDQTEFTSSSIAYGFQVSTIYPFLFWGASLFLFVPLMNALFWGIGIFIFFLCFNKIKNYLGSGKTLPGLIGEAYGNSTRLISALLTIVGFIGYIIAELWFGSRVLLSIFPNNNYVYIATFIFTFFIAIYLFKGGQLSSIKTDQLQLTFTYLGVFGIVIYLLYLLLSKNVIIEGALFWGLILLVILIILILSIRKFSFFKLKSSASKIINTFVSLSFISIFCFSIYIIFNNEIHFKIENFINLEGFGVAGLISLIILPLTWQFVDLTNWQRLLSVKTSKNSKEEIKKGLLNFAIESPFTWILFIVLGIIIILAYPDWTFNDILVDFPKQLITSNSIVNIIFGYTFIVSIISIMLSTIDSFFMGISFTYTYDINSKNKIFN